MSRCNYCTMDGLRKFAAQTSQEVTTVPAPLPYFPDGVSVYIGGRWVAWLAKLPTECCCGGD